MKHTPTQINFEYEGTKDCLEFTPDSLKETEKKYGVKLYLDSRVDWGKTWMDASVYIHGDRHIVNLVCMKLIVWQHYQKIRDGILFAYPAEDMK